MDSTLLTCEICYEEFNLTNHLLRILPDCGHTMCSECLEKLLQNPDKNKRSCHLDKQPFPVERVNVDGFKVNFALKTILEAQSQKELCTEHNEEMNVICYTDEKKICGSCVCEGLHQNHKTKTTKAIELEANRQTKKIKDTLNNLDIYYSKASHSRAEMKALLLERVKNEFTTIKKAIIEKEQDIIFQIHSYFYKQEQNIDNLTGIKKDLHNDAASLENILKNEEFLKNGELFQKIQDHLANYKTEVDFQVIQRETEVIKSKIEDVVKSLKDLHDSQAQILSQFKFGLEKNIFKNLALGILKDLPVQSSNSPDEIETEEKPFVFKVSTSLSIKYHQGKLTISTAELCKENTIDIEKWKDAKDVYLFLNHHISEEDLEVLALILRKIQGDGLLYLEFSSNGFYQKVLEFFAQTSLSFSRVDMNLAKLDLTAVHVSVLIGKILTQNTHLEGIKLSLIEAKLSKNACCELLGGILSNGINLKSLHLDLNNTNTNDYDICQFSLSLPNIKHFELGLKNTNITDRIIEWLGRNLFQPISCLESFKLYLNGTQITDTHMEDLFSGFNKLKKLTLDLAATKITDITLEALSRLIRNAGDGLEELVIGLASNNVTDEGVSLMILPLPNVTKLTLSFSSTKITNKTVELLAQKTLSSTLKLKHFSLFLAKLSVTDSSMLQIFKALPQLDELDIRLISTRVTDISVAPFIIDTVPAMKGLTKFKMTTSDTNVSSEVQAKIQELEKTINSVE